MVRRASRRFVRRVFTTVLFLALAVAIAPKLIAGAHNITNDKPTGSTTSTTGSMTSGTPQASGTVTGIALAALNKLPVRPLGSISGYSRTSQFGTAWTDNNGDPWGHNGCDTRNDILHRDLTSITYKSGSHCYIATGILHEPYTGKTIHFVRGVRTSSLVQIDHVVPLGLVYEEGGKNWTQAKRVNIANDPLNLLSADGPANEAKGDSDASEWLPANKSFQCQYVAIQVAVSAKYGLPITAAAKSAMTKVLNTCPGKKLPVEPGGQRA